MPCIFYYMPYVFSDILEMLFFVAVFRDFIPRVRRVFFH